MTEVAAVPWPPAPIRTARLVLRAGEARDREGIIELFASPEVGAYVGGAQPRKVLEQSVPRVPRRPGLGIVELDGTMIGIVTLDRRDPERKGHIRPEGGEVELGYMLLPKAWGNGYATEACSAALEWLASALPGEPVVLSTQLAHLGSLRVAAKLGFREVQRFDDYGAQQWLGVRQPPTPAE